MAPTLWLQRRFRVTRFQRPFASPRPGHRLHHSAPASSSTAPGRPQGPLCAGECRDPSPTRGWRRPSPRTGRGCSRAGSADGQGCLHRKAPPRPGGDRRRTTAGRECSGPRAGWRTQFGSPYPAVPRGSPTWESPGDAFHLQITSPAPAPPRCLRAAGCSTKFLSARRVARLT